MAYLQHSDMIKPLIYPLLLLLPFGLKSWTSFSLVVSRFTYTILYDRREQEQQVAKKRSEKLKIWGH